jgi:hypothetical protein|nr:MAG TPA: hypothetical protein [Caudoviricetes sp.]
MDNIFMNVTDKNIAARKVYTKAADTFAYADADCTKKISAADLQDTFIKGMIIVDATGIQYLPVSCEVKKNVATVTYVTTDSTTSTTAKLATVKSE